MEREELRKYRHKEEQTADMRGGEFLLSLGHPYAKTAATEGWPPNAELCRRMPEPPGIRFRPFSSEAHMPFPDESFDIVISRHGSCHADEVYRLLKLQE